MSFRNIYKLLQFKGAYLLGYQKFSSILGVQGVDKARKLFAKTIVFAKGVHARSELR